MYQLLQKALQRLLALIRAGAFVDKAFSFSVADSNALLGDNNWVEFSNWFLGHAEGRPDPSSDTSVVPEKDDFAYPFAKAGVVYLPALEQIIKQARKAGDAAIADAAASALQLARAKVSDSAKASRDQGKRVIAFKSALDIKAAADGAVAKIPTFAIVAYTGGPMNLEGWEYPVVVDLAGIDVTDKSRPALRDHDPCKVVGHTRSIDVADGKLLADGLVSGVGPHVDEICASAANGFPWQASIGATVVENSFIPQGQSATANGREFLGPINIARRTSLGEISIVALGADDDTSARIAAQTQSKAARSAKGSVMDFDAWLKAKGFSADALTGEQATALKAMFNDESKKKDDDADAARKLDIAAKKKAGAGGGGGGDPPPDAAAIATAAIKATRDATVVETTRINKVRAALNAKRDEVPADKFAEIETKALGDGWDVDKTELELLRAARPAAPKTFGINTGAGANITGAAIAAAACMSNGMAQDVACLGLDQRTANIVAGKALRGIGLQSIFAMVASNYGIHVLPGRIDNDTIRAVLMAERSMDIRAAGGGEYATMSLSGITENILNKAMLQAYGNVPSIVSDIAYETDTNDFKVFKRYRLTASGQFQLVGPAGDLKSMSLQDESYANQVQTRGATVVLTRQIIINDDMSALTQTPTIVGRQGAISREKLVLTTYLGAIGSFFASGNNNYLSGAGSALGIAGLTTAVQTFRQQKDANKDPIMVQPNRLLVPPALEAPADNLFNGANLVVTALGSTSSKSVDPNLNQHARKYRPVVSPFLAASGGLANASDTGWSLLADPADGFAVVQVGYLRGQRTPIIERGETNLDTLGIGFRAYFDFGVALHDNRCGVYSAGA